MKIVGQAVPHESAHGHVTGEALYTDDLLTRLPNLLHAWPALASSAQQLEGELAIGGQEHFYLETQCSIAWLDESGGVMVESSTQHPSETQEIVARTLGLERHRVTVECLRMGGAFGGKEVQ